MYAAQARAERLSPMWPTDTVSRVDSSCARYSLSIHLSRKVKRTADAGSAETVGSYCLLARRKIKDITMSLV